MQTFLPFPTALQSASVIDNKRLVAQVKEAAQILQILVNPARYNNAPGYLHHPIVDMWRGHERALALYGQTFAKEYESRFKKTHKAWPFFCETFTTHGSPDGNFVIPPWIGDEEFHKSHRRALLSKDYYWYKSKPFFALLIPIVKYLWYDPARRQWFIISKKTRKREYIIPITQ